MRNLKLRVRRLIARLLTLGIFGIMFAVVVNIALFYVFRGPEMPTSEGLLQSAAPFTSGVILDGHVVPGDAMVISDQVLVPCRALFEQLGYKVRWDHKRKLVSVQGEDLLLYFSPDKPGMFFNGAFRSLSIPMVKKDSTTYIPLRDVCEYLGFPIRTDKANRTIYVRSNESFPVNTSVAELEGDSFQYQTWKDNLAMVLSLQAPTEYLSLDGFDKAERSELKQLSDMICKGVRDPYDKARLISQWVSDNLYYDFDYLRDRSNAVKRDTMGVLREGVAVCDGYSGLLVDLLRSQAIPATRIRGKVIDPDTGTWYEETGHQWACFYTERTGWQFVDPTWNSNNRFEYGERISRSSDFQYFGIDLYTLSRSHSFEKQDWKGRFR